MSGREREPITAFFPSIDRNLIRDLDRHLRGASHPERPDQEPGTPHPQQVPAQPRQAARPSTADILEAVDQAAASMTAMHTRIQDLEVRQTELETANNQLKAKLGELLHAQQVAETATRAERERAERAEHVGAQYQSRVQVLENDLATALGDLNRISEAITGALAHVPD